MPFCLFGEWARGSAGVIEMTHRSKQMNVISTCPPRWPGVFPVEQVFQACCVQDDVQEISYPVTVIYMIFYDAYYILYIRVIMI